jgi:hypothetical protein
LAVRHSAVIVRQLTAVLDQQDRIELFVAGRRRTIDAIVRHLRIVSDVDALLCADQDESARRTEILTRNGKST